MADSTSALAGNLTRLRPFTTGTGRVEFRSGVTRLVLPASSSRQYSDAQIDDYAGLPRRAYRHRPPLRLSLRARFSHGRPADPALAGTAGFGFWNNPFGAQSKLPTLPQAIWFFYASPPSNLALAREVPGCGWKAACLDARRASALAWIPPAPFVLLACRRPALYRALLPRVQRALGISEALLEFRSGDVSDWHAYELEWQRDGARWSVDGAVALEADRPPSGPLGFVAWLDNQYAVVTPQGRIRFGLLDVPDAQWLDIADVGVA